MKRTNAIRLAITLTVLLCLVLLAGCGAARAIYGASIGIGEAITIKRDIARQGQLSVEDERQITQGLLDADRALLQVTDTADCFTQYTKDVKRGVIRALDDTTTALDKLNDQGALRIKNEKARERFKQKLFYASVAIKGIRTTLWFIPAKESANEALSEKQQRELDDLRALCRKASAQLKENESRLLEDLARLPAGQ